MFQRADAKHDTRHQGCSSRLVLAIKLQSFQILNITCVLLFYSCNNKLSIFSNSSKVCYFIVPWMRIVVILLITLVWVRKQTNNNRNIIRLSFYLKTLGKKYRLSSIFCILARSGSLQLEIGDHDFFVSFSEGYSKTAVLSALWLGPTSQSYKWFTESHSHKSLF